MQSGMLQNCFLALSTDSDIYQDLAGFMNLTAENTKTCIASTFDQLTGLFKASKALTEMMSGTTFPWRKLERRGQPFFWWCRMKRQRIIFWQSCLFRSVMKSAGSGGCMQRRASGTCQFYSGRILQYAKAG